MDSPAEIGEEAGAHRVGPMKVLDHKNDRTLGRLRADQFDQRIEEQCVLRPRDRWLFIRRGEFREDSHQLGPRRGAEAVAQTGVQRQAVGTKRLDPRIQRQCLLGLVTAANENARSLGERIGCELLDQSSLADSGLTADHQRVPPASDMRRVPCADARAQPRARSTVPVRHSQTSWKRARWEPGSSRRSSPPGTRGPQDLPVQFARRFLRLDGSSRSRVATHT